MSWHLRELEKRGLSLMIYRRGELVYSSAGGGIRPLVEAVEALGLEELSGAVVVDKVVGRAAALIAAHMGASECHAGTMSAGAKEVLLRRAVGFSFEVETTAILGRGGLGPCPFERLVEGTSDPAEAYLRLRALALGR